MFEPRPTRPVPNRRQPAQCPAVCVAAQQPGANVPADRRGVRRPAGLRAPDHWRYPAHSVTYIVPDPTGKLSPRTSIPTCVEFRKTVLSPRSGLIVSGRTTGKNGPDIRIDALGRNRRSLGAESDHHTASAPRRLYCTTRSSGLNPCAGPNDAAKRLAGSVARPNVPRWRSIPGRPPTQ